METTRHFTATVYIVEGGATALHHHDRLGIRVPPGGHVDRDELPHEAGLREVREETGLDATLVAETPDVDAPGGEALPDPACVMLYDVDVHENGRVAHQHIDHVYFARVASRDISPDGRDEAAPEAWEWYTASDLRASELDADAVQLGLEAIDAVGDEAASAGR